MAQGSTVKRATALAATYLVGSAALSQVITLLTAPIITRLYSPSDFGIFSIANSIFGIVCVVICLRFEIAIVIPLRMRTVTNLIALCGMVTLLMSGLTALACTFFLHVDAPGHESRSHILTALIAISMLGFGLQQICRMWCVRNRKFWPIAVMQMTQSILTAGLQIFLGTVFGSNPTHLLLALAISIAASCAAPFAIMVSDFPRPIAGQVTLPRLIATVRRFRRFPIFTAPYIFLQQATSRGVLFLLASAYAVSVVGEFSLAQRIVIVPVAVIMASAGQIYYGYAAREIGSAKFKELVLRVLHVANLVLVPPFILTALLMPKLVSVLFGAAWLQAGHFAAILAIPAMFLTITGWLDRTYDVLQRQKTALVMEALNNVAAFSGLLIALRLHASPMAAAMTFGAITSVYAIVWTSVTLVRLGVSIAAIASVVGALIAAPLYCGLVDALAFHAGDQFPTMSQASLLALANLPVLLLAVFLARRFGFIAWGEPKVSRA